MARRTVQAGYLARRIGELQARGMTRAQVARATGIGERTQRKLIAGSTPGTRVYRRVIPAATGLGRGPGRRGVDIPRSAEPGHFSIVVVCTDGTWARVPIILRQYENATHLTVFDKARIIEDYGVREVIESELQKQRGTSPPKTREQLKLCRAVDVVPIITSHTANIPWVTLAQ